jgi:MFS family permease
VIDRFGFRAVIVAAMLSMSAGMLLLSGIGPGGTYAGNVLAGALATALGMGFSLVPATIVAMQGVPGAQSGVASGLLNTSRLMGGALGLAVLSTIAATESRGQVGVGAARALTDGFDLAFTVATGFALAAALIAAVALRTRASEAEVLTIREPVDVDVAGVELQERDALVA